jgi:oligoribonuclease (3'-5' exoribonuclease)
MSSHQFLWLDLETTGLDPIEPGAMILEWAYVLAADDFDGDMSVIDSCYSPVKCDVDPTALNPYVRKMHTANGLLAEIRLSDGDLPTIGESDEMLLSVCQELTGQEQPKGLVLAGSSVHFDLGWVRVHMPRFAACLSPRVFDVSVLKAFARTYGRDFPELPESKGAHRALNDVMHSLEYAKLFRAGWVQASAELPLVERGVRYSLCSPTPVESKKAGGYGAWKVQQASREDRYVCEAMGS